MPRVRQRDLQSRARAGDPAQVAQHPLRIDEVLEHVEAQDRVEPAVELLQRLLDRRGEDLVVEGSRELGLLGHDLDAGQPRGARAPQPRTHAAGPAAHIEHGADRPR